VKTIGILTDEVMTFCKDKGWYDKPVSWEQSMALLHSEVSEALEACRQWGMEDATDTSGWRPRDAMAGILPKPEGVGSELADLFIRMLDDAGRWGLSLEESGVTAIPEISDNFPENVQRMHRLIDMADAEHEMSFDPSQPLSALLSYLILLCSRYDIDLMAEYERKMAYNRTRPYRHGNKVV
jgi:NTP pyrophosphatase (non-canonical NTP hydrolase)